MDRPFECTVVDAALATISTLRSYAPVRIGRQDYVGASLGYNNPTREAILEAWNIYGVEARVACILSLGAGVSPPRTAEASLNNLHDILEDCDRLALELAGQYRETGVYFRLSVDRGFSTLHFNDCDDSTAGLIEAHTKVYLDGLNGAQRDPIDCLQVPLIERVGQVAIGALSTSIGFFSCSLSRYLRPSSHYTRLRQNCATCYSIFCTTGRHMGEDERYISRQA